MIALLHYLYLKSRRDHSLAITSTGARRKIASE